MRCTTPHSSCRGRTDPRRGAKVAEGGRSGISYRVAVYRDLKKMEEILQSCCAFTDTSTVALLDAHLSYHSVLGVGERRRRRAVVLDVVLAQLLLLRRVRELEHAPSAPPRPRPRPRAGSLSALSLRGLTLALGRLQLGLIGPAVGQRLLPGEGVRENSGRSGVARIIPTGQLRSGVRDDDETDATGDACCARAKAKRTGLSGSCPWERR